MSESIWDDPRITAYVLGDLPKDQCVEFEQRLESDSELAAAVEEARSVTGQLQSLYDEESMPALDAARRESIVAGAESKSEEAASLTIQEKHANWPVLISVFASAAVFLFSVGVLPRLLQESETPVSKVSEPPTSMAVDLREEADRTVEISPQQLEGFALIEDQETKRVSDSSRLSEVDQRQGSTLPVAQDSDKYTAPANDSRSKEFYSQNAKLVLPEVAAEPKPTAAPADEKKKSFRTTKLHHGRPIVYEFAEGNSVPVIVDEAFSESQSKPILSKNPTATTTTLEKEIQELQRLQKRVEKFSKQREMVAGQSHLSEERYRLAQKQVELSKRLAGEQAALANLRNEARKISQLESKLRVLHEGEGPGNRGDQFQPITDNPFVRVAEDDISTFSVDVDTASYSKVRDFLMRAGTLPRPDAVRIEEMVNYFDYRYEPPTNDAKHPFSVDVAVTACPWNEKHYLARIGIKGKTMKKSKRPRCNLVFLLDTSGSMNRSNKLPLVQKGMRMLVDHLHKDDRVAIVVYAGSAGLVLDSTKVRDKEEILRALTALSAGGSTNGGQGIALAYQTARSNFLSEGVNRVILCTDGDFNVGVTGTDALVRIVEEEAKDGTFLSVLGFGMGNHNDAMLEQISGRGNGNYAFIDTENEARKVLVQQTSGTLVTIAKDVKLQLDFNGSKVSQYRLLGYENRVMANADFKDDKKDAGEIGAGHTVTALYEIVPAGLQADASQPPVDESKYQKTVPTEAADSDELLTLKLRYKEPDGDVSTELQFDVKDEVKKFSSASEDTRFAAAVAGFGMQLRKSPYAGSWAMQDVLKTAIEAKGKDKHGLRAEFVDIVRRASEIITGE